MIAFEKSGIIKNEIPTIIGYQPYPEAKEILLDQAEYKKAPIFAHEIHWNLTEHNNKLIYEDNQNKIEFDKLNTQIYFRKKTLDLHWLRLQNYPILISILLSLKIFTIKPTFQEEWKKYLMEN